METKYQRATRWVCDEAEDQIADKHFKLPDTTFEVALVLEQLDFDCFEDQGRLIYSGSYELAEKMIDLARKDPKVHELCSYLCKNSLIANRPMPPAFRLFSAEMHGCALRPTREGRPPTRWLERERLYSLAENVRALFGLRLSRNAATAEISACDAVAEGLTICGRPTSYEEVRRLHFGKKTAGFRDEVAEINRLRALKLDRELAWLMTPQFGSSDTQRIEASLLGTSSVLPEATIGSACMSKPR